MFSFNTRLTPASARNAALVNQLATPGLGTLMLGKLVLGFSQLALAIAGFALVLVWFVAVLGQYYGQISGNVEVKPVGWIGLTGAGLFAVAWLWSLVTSIGFIRTAKREAEQERTAPPVMSNKERSK